MIGVKRCRACGEEKVLAAFHRSQKEEFGRKGICKSCHSARYAKAAGYTPPAEASRLAATSVRRDAKAKATRTCTRCGETKNLREFGRQKSGHISPICMGCRTSLDEDRLPGHEKRCRQCGEVKSVDKFPKAKLGISGVQPYCRVCWNERARGRSKEARRLERERYSAKRGKPLGPRRDDVAYRARRQLVRDLQRFVRRQEAAERREAERRAKPWLDPSLSGAEQYRLRYRLDPTFQLSERLRRQRNKAAKRLGIATLMRGAIKSGGQSPAFEQAMGYSIDDLRSHLERQFTRGMTMDRLRAGDIHIDHIVPVRSFDLTDDAQYRACWSLPNLRPLWAKDNIRKAGKRLHLL